jgi:DNA-binding XRE family transcriptional regulator
VIREARDQLDLSQVDVGAQAGVSRYPIHRVEAERQDLSRGLAEKLAKVLGRPQLIDLVEQRIQAETRDRPQTSHGAYRSRDEKLHELLRAPSLDRLVIVLADDFDVVTLLQEHRLNLPSTTSVIFPSELRQTDLEGASGRQLPTWDVQGRINDLFAAVAPGGSLNPSNGQGGADYESIRLYESDLVRQSLVLVGSPGGPQCATWPCIPGAGVIDPEAVPAAVTSDPMFLRHVEEHVSLLLAERQPLTHLKAVVTVKDESDTVGAKGDEQGRGEARHDLSRFFSLGQDTEEDWVDAADADGQNTATYGFAVALVLIHGYIDRPGRSIARRILLPIGSGGYELFSAHISDEDLRIAYPDAQTEEATSWRERSTRTAKNAKDDFMLTSQAPVVSSDDFRRAAVHGIKDELGVSVTESWLDELKLPPDLWGVEKCQDSRRMLSVIPRLFALDLAPKENDTASRARRSHLRRLEQALMEKTPPAKAFGYQDLVSSQDQLGDFLRRALNEKGDWFVSHLQQLGIEP